MPNTTHDPVIETHEKEWNEIDDLINPSPGLWNQALAHASEYGDPSLTDALTRDWQTSYQMNDNDVWPDAAGMKNAILEKSVEDRKVLERLIKTLKNQFYGDESITSFAPVRLLTWWNKNLSDEITYLKHHGAIYDDPDAKPYKETAGPGRLQSPFTKKELTDPDAAKTALMEALVWHGKDSYDNWDPFSEIDGIASTTTKTGSKAQARMDGFERVITKAFLTGDLDHSVLGIDLETTGASPYRNWVVNAGWMTCDPNDVEGEAMHGETIRYYGMTPTAMENGLPAYVKNGCDLSQMEGKTILELDPDAQEELAGILTSRTIVAHNARFEDSMFEMTVPGYAEAKRAGRIKIIDTLRMSRSFDPYEGKASNTLEDWAHHWGCLPEDEGEHHIGLDDTLVMLQAMIRNYQQARLDA